MTLPIIL